MGRLSTTLCAAIGSHLPIRRRVPAWTDKEHDEDWDYIVRTVIERAWRGVRGQG